MDVLCEPADIDELLLRLRNNARLQFVRRPCDPSKDPINEMGRMGMLRGEAEIMIHGLQKNEFVAETECDDRRLRCTKMWVFKHHYAPKDGRGPYEIYIKLGSVVDDGLPEKEAIIVIVISFHEDV